MLRAQNFLQQFLQIFCSLPPAKALDVQQGMFLGPAGGSQKIFQVFPGQALPESGELLVRGQASLQSGQTLLPTFLPQLFADKDPPCSCWDFS